MLVSWVFFEVEPWRTWRSRGVSFYLAAFYSLEGQFRFHKEVASTVYGYHLEHDMRHSLWKDCSVGRCRSYYATWNMSSSQGEHDSELAAC